jgi:hypothetical protein
LTEHPFKKSLWQTLPICHQILNDSADARDSAAKDKREVMQKRQEYHGFMDWTDRDIVHDLARLHDIHKPALSLLLPIATTMSARIGVPLGRQEKRRKDLPVGWINKHYDQICGFVPQLVFRDQTRGVKGASVGAMEQISRKDSGGKPWKLLELNIIAPLNRSKKCPLMDGMVHNF